MFSRGANSSKVTSIFVVFVPGVALGGGSFRPPLQRGGDEQISRLTVSLFAFAVFSWFLRVLISL